MIMQTEYTEADAVEATESAKEVKGAVMEAIEKRGEEHKPYPSSISLLLPHPSLNY